MTGAIVCQSCHRQLSVGEACPDCEPGAGVIALDLRPPSAPCCWIDQLTHVDARAAACDPVDEYDMVRIKRNDLRALLDDRDTLAALPSAPVTTPPVTDDERKALLQLVDIIGPDGPFPQATGLSHLVGLMRKRCTAPPAGSREDVEKAITAYGNAMFDCGDYDEGDVPTFAELRKREQAARAALRALYVPPAVPEAETAHDKKLRIDAEAVLTWEKPSGGYNVLLFGHLRRFAKEVLRLLPTAALPRTGDGDTGGQENG